MHSRVVWLAVAAALLLVAAACQSQPVTGPSVAPGGTPRGFALFPTDSPTPTATSTATATPTATPTPTTTPTPTATPLSASPAGRAPLGLVVFGVQRGDAPAEQLWWLDERGQLATVAESVIPGGWTCGPAQPAPVCAVASTDGYLLAANPVSQTATLLDQIGPGRALSPTAAGADPALSQLALSPDGSALAVVLPDRVDLYALDSPALTASIAVTGVAELAWSPDGQFLSLVYPAAVADALALWNRESGKLRVIAQSDNVQHTVWSPDSEKVAFDASQSPATPSSQGDKSDVYVVFLRSGEVANMSEVFLRNAGVAAANQIAAWSPQWQSTDELRYVRGVPDAPDTHAVWSHPLRSRTARQLWQVDDEGLLGIVRSPDGVLDARAVTVDGRVVVQVSPAESREWADLPGAYDRLNGLIWAPLAGSAEPARYLLLAQDQTLLTVDADSGAIQGLALACPECRITRVSWLPE